MKCQKCAKAATLHITEILGEEQIEELHLCEECAQKYLYEPQQKQTGIKTAPAATARRPTSRPSSTASATSAASSSSISATPAGSAARTTTRSSATS